MKKPIEIFVRHCNVSANSVGKNRPKGFSREKCWRQLLRTASPGKCNITAVFDGHPEQEHFIKSEYPIPFKLVELENGGDDARSFLNMLNYIMSQNIDDETIVYILEDDYMHKDLWEDILLEVFNSMNIDYVTTYDHRDKYELPMYEGLQSVIFATKSCHWRTTPSTTNTYACKFKTLKKHIDIHRSFCDLSRGYTRDHDKFTHLWSVGSNLISSIPGYSTHMETEYLSPCINWEEE